MRTYRPLLNAAVLLASGIAVACGANINVGDRSDNSGGTSGSAGAGGAGATGGSGGAGAGVAIGGAPSTPNWEGDWEWLTPLTTTQTLTAAWAAAADDIWLASDTGAVLRWDGKTRAHIVYQGPLDARYRAIIGTSENDVLVAGDHHALRFNGVSWTASLYLAKHNVRKLIREGGKSSFVALTEEGKAYRVQPNWPYLSTKDALDVIPAADGHYALKEDGVDWYRKGHKVERVASFTVKNASKVLAGRLLGLDATSFRYLFSYERESSEFIYYGYFKSNPSTDPYSLLFRKAWQTGEFLAGAGDNKFLVRRYAHDRLRMLDDSGVRSSDTSAKNIQGALTLASGEPGVVGVKGLLASVKPDSAPNKLRLVSQAKHTGAKPELFQVAPDSSAWAVKGETVAYETKAFSLGNWNDATGWTWHALPNLSLEKQRPLAMVPLSKSSVWLAVRTSDAKNPKYYGADTLLHWNGTSFDKTLQAPVSLRLLVPDGDNGFFALATDGVLYRGTEQGQLTLLADAGTAGEGSYQICTPTVAPVPGGATAWVLDSVCQLTFWNGKALEQKPTFRSEVHGSGWISFELAALSEKSLWVTDPQQGLIHFDGKSWNQIWKSENVPHGIWAADEKHVWLIDAAYVDTGKQGQLRMWNGKAMQTVTATPYSFFLSGSKDSVWLAGDTSLLRLLRKPDVVE